MTRLARRAVSRTARAAVLVLFVLVAAAGVVAASWAGIVLAGDRPPSDAHPWRSTHGAVRARDWTQLASLACVRGRRETNAMLDRATSLGGSRAAVTLRVLRGDIHIEGRLLKRLQRLHPGRADRGPYREALRLFRSARAADRRLAANLARGWGGRSLAVQSRRGEQLNGRIRLRFYQVGAFGCATYFDPRSW